MPADKRLPAESSRKKEKEREKFAQCFTGA